MVFIYSQDCSDGYTYFSELPESATINSGDSCLFDLNLSVLNDIIIENDLDYDAPINVGNQTWNNG